MDYILSIIHIHCTLHTATIPVFLDGETHVLTQRHALMVHRSLKYIKSTAALKLQKNA